MANLQVHVDGLTLPNPFVIGSGPPGTNANVIKKATWNKLPEAINLEIAAFIEPPGGY